MSAATSAKIDPALLPAVREAQGSLLSSIFSHPAFDGEAEREYGKLFFVFQETIAANEALEVAHLGEDTDNATRAALEVAIENNSRVVEDGEGGADGSRGELLKLAKERYRAQGKDVEGIVDVDLGSEIRGKARAVKNAAENALGK